MASLQNLVDSLGQRFQEAVPRERHNDLNTFVVFNQRRRVTSSAKRKRKPGSTVLAQTPDGSFLDLMRNAAELLRRCGLSNIPEVRRVIICLDHDFSAAELVHQACMYTALSLRGAAANLLDSLGCDGFRITF